MSSLGSKVTLNILEHAWSPCDRTSRDGWALKTPRRWFYTVSTFYPYRKQLVCRRQSWWCCTWRISSRREKEEVTSGTVLQQLVHKPTLSQHTTLASEANTSNTFSTYHTQFVHHRQINTYQPPLTLVDFWNIQKVQSDGVISDRWGNIGQVGYHRTGGVTTSDRWGNFGQVG